MARVRPLEREDLPAEHRHIYDDIAGSRGGVQPNFKALLNNPLATARMAALGGYVRFETPLSSRVKILGRSGHGTGIRRRLCLDSQPASGAECWGG